MACNCQLEVDEKNIAAVQTLRTAFTKVCWIMCVLTILFILWASVLQVTGNSNKQGVSCCVGRASSSRSDPGIYLWCVGC